ncbi:MAG: hypothetical protein ACRCU5_02380 [Rhizobiaceae bacterium]
MKKLFLYAGFFLTFGGAAAQAETINVDVSSGSTTRIYTFSVYDRDTCGSGGKPKITIYQPDHGTISSAFVPLKLDKANHCSGKPVKGLAITYKSKGGYRGIDKGSFVISYPQFTDGTGFQAYTFKLNANVK